METILVWVFVSMSTRGIVSYSPPLATYEDCKRISLSGAFGHRGKCAQVNMVITK
jgi:hypothetical protein